MKLKKLFVYIFILVFLSACAYQSSTAGGSIGVERKQLMLLSSAQMNSESAKIYSQVINDANKKNVLNADKIQLSKLRTIATRLIEQTKVFRADAPSWRWEVNLINSKELNAWCMPGGKIVFYSGIINNLQLNDDEIAAIMGHEMAHALREHSRERSSQSMITNTTIQIASTLLGFGQAATSLASQAANIAITLPNSRANEEEADRMGVELSARAGYDPRAAITLWEKMKRASQGAPPEFLSTHPSHDSRIADLNEHVNKVMHLYKKS
jgi:predicted Zn-dependent protease